MAVRVTAATATRRASASRSSCCWRRIHRRYGYDFRGYALASLRRRLWHRVYGEGLETISGLQERVLHDPACMDRLLRDLSINVTEMFRDPSFHRALREQVFPLLRTYPFIRIWNAGCSTGEEIYSLAIALREEGLLERTRIYATDIDEAALQRARSGAFPLERMQLYTENYLRAGGTESFSRYYSADGDVARFDPALARGDRLRPAQPRHGRLVQRVSADRVPQRADLLRRRAAGGGARRSSATSMTRFGDPRARAQGVDPPLAPRRASTSRSSRPRRSTGRRQ